MNRARQSATFLLVLMVVCCFPALARAESGVRQITEIKVTAGRFSFQPDRIAVQQGNRVRLLLESRDVVHGFAINEFEIDRRIEPARTTIVEFTPNRPGTFRFYCSLPCGDGHSEMSGMLVVTASEAQPASHMKVTFDPDSPGVVILESGGEKIRIDTSTRTIAALGAPSNHPPTQAEPARTEPRARIEAYDYRLVNVPTPKRVPRGSLNLHFTHRFSEPLTSLPGEDAGAHARRIASDLLGLDSFSLSSFGVSYGLTDKLYAVVYRSPVAQKGLFKTVEIGLGYHLLDEGQQSPLALSVYGSIEGDDNFSEHFTYNAQAMLGRSVTRHADVFFSPAVHFNTNGQGRFNPRPEDFFPPAEAASDFELGQHTASFGFGVNARIRPSVSLLFEFTPRAGFKLGQVVPLLEEGTFRIVGFENRSEPEIGFGIEKRIGRHSFALTFSNTQTTTTSRYNSSNLFLSPSKFTIGFNLFRRLR